MFLLWITNQMVTFYITFSRKHNTGLIIWWMYIFLMQSILNWMPQYCSGHKTFTRSSIKVMRWYFERTYSKSNIQTCFCLEGRMHSVVVGDGRSQAKGSTRTSRSKREAASRARESRPQDGGICTMLWTRYDATGILQTEIFNWFVQLK